jgi:thiosulfate dehydrogenase [quinone] large subunit
VDVNQAGSAAFTIPFDAPSPLPAGDPGIVVKLRDGTFAGYDAVCTHAGCTVEYDATDAIIFCPCHGAEFDPAHDAAVIAGPTRQPLAKLPLVVDPATGTISLSTS